MKLIKQSEYPKFVHVGCERYKILFKKGFKHFGETDSSAKTITIKYGLSPRETIRTFIHELFHALDFENDIGLKHSKVYKLEESVFNLLFDNFF